MSKFVAVQSMPNVSDKGTFQEIGYVHLDEQPIVIDKITIATWEGAADKRVNTFPKLRAFYFIDQNGVKWIATKIDRGSIGFTKESDMVGGR